jgi:hypothetical protein
MLGFLGFAQAGVDAAGGQMDLRGDQGLAGEPGAHAFRRAVDDLEQSDVAVGRGVGFGFPDIGLAQEILGEELVHRVGDGGLLSRFLSLLFRQRLGAGGAEGLPGAEGGGQDQHDGDDRGGGDEGLMASGELAELIDRARRAGEDRFVRQVPAYVGGEFGGGVVASATVFLDCLEDDPVEIVLDEFDQGGRFAAPIQGDGAQSAVHAAV